MTSARQIYLGSRRGPALPYDAEVEYLESTGTQWIDTGISGSMQNLVITTKVRVNTYSAYAGSFGNYVSEQANVFRLILTGSNDGWAYANCGYIASSSHQIRNFSLGNWHTVVLDGVNDRCFCDGVDFSKATHFGQGSANNRTIRLFTSGGNTSGTSIRQISAYKVEAGDVLVRDFVPVRFMNEQGVSEGAMYDRVSGQLFRNSGTGVFGFGTDIAGGGV